MININDWSYKIEKNLVRITFNQPLSKKIIAEAKQFNGNLLTNVHGEKNEFFFAFKNQLVVQKFITSLKSKYPNSFSLQNKWDISQTGNNIVTFSYFFDFDIVEINIVISSILADFNTISSLVKEQISNFELNLDSSTGYINFDIAFSGQIDSQSFIKDFNRFQQ